MTSGQPRTNTLNYEFIGLGQKFCSKKMIFMSPPYKKWKAESSKESIFVNVERREFSKYDRNMITEKDMIRF
jgi:hypothetical protein